MDEGVALGIAGIVAIGAGSFVAGVLVILVVLWLKSRKEKKSG